MKYIKLEGIGREVSAVSLGLAELGAAVPVQDGYRILDAYLDMGGNLLDTARVYSDWLPGEWGRSEKLLGEWLASRRARGRVAVATKGAHPRLSSMHTPRLSAAEVEEDLNLSLKALGVDAIDLYYLHRDDESRPVEEILATLEGFARAGKIRRYACSNWTAPRMLEAHECARRHGWQGFAANQVFWNLGSENSAGPLDDTCVAFGGELRRAFESTGILASAYSSQAGGFFTKLERGAEVSGSIYDTSGNRRVYEKAADIAARTGIPLSQVALGYILFQPIPAVAVVGCRSMEQLEDSMAAAGRALTPDMIDELEKAVEGSGIV